MGQTVEVEIDEARQILGVDETADDEALREAHRREIRRVHPDAGGSASAAAGVNRAWDVLRRLGPADGTALSSPRPSPTAASAARHRPLDVDEYFLVDVEPNRLLARLADAGHDVGEVVFVDPHAGLLEIVVGDEPAVGQLAVTIGAPVEGGTEVSFTLEALGVTPAPPIGPVVAALMAAVQG